MKNITKIDFTAANTLVFVTVVAYLIQTSVSYGSLIFGLNLNFLVYGFYWQPLTSIFSHGGVFHLIMNMFVLWQFGNLIEKIIGAKRFLLLYFVTGILTSLLSFVYIFFINVNINLVGASGAICAILGYVAYFDKNQRKSILTWIAIISLVPLLINIPIAWFAHFIGVSVGFAYAIIEKNFFIRRYY